MKKIIVFFTLFFLLFINTNAQTFKLNGGFNFSDIDMSGTDNYGFKMFKNHVGLLYEHSVFSKFSVETGITYTTKGGKLGINEYNAINLYLYYVDFPLNLKYTHKINEFINVYGKAGAYLDVGVKGTISNGSINTYYYSSNPQTIKWGNDILKHDLIRNDYGFSLGLGITVTRFELSFLYDHGLANILTNKSGGAYMYNRLFRLSVSYLFQKNKKKQMLKKLKKR